MSENAPEVNAPENEQPMSVTPDILLAQIVTHIGENFVVISMEDWGKTVETIKESTDDTLLEKMEALNISVVPVSLSPKQEESRIIMPDDVPKGDSKIIMP